MKKRQKELLGKAADTLDAMATKCGGPGSGKPGPCPAGGTGKPGAAQPPAAYKPPKKPRRIAEIVDALVEMAGDAHNLMMGKSTGTKCGGPGGKPGPCPGGGAGKPSSKPGGDSDEIDSVLTKMDSVGRAKTAAYKKKLGVSEEMDHKSVVSSLTKQGFKHTATVDKKDSSGKSTNTTSVCRKGSVAVLVTNWAHAPQKTDLQFFESRKSGASASGTSGGSRNT